MKTYNIMFVRDSPLEHFEMGSACCVRCTGGNTWRSPQTGWRSGWGPAGPRGLACSRNLNKEFWQWKNFLLPYLPELQPWWRIWRQGARGGWWRRVRRQRRRWGWHDCGRLHRWTGGGRRERRDQGETSWSATAMLQHWGHCRNTSVIRIYHLQFWVDNGLKNILIHRFHKINIFLLQTLCWY